MYGTIVLNILLSKNNVWHNLQWISNKNMAVKYWNMRIVPLVYKFSGKFSTHHGLFV